MLRFMPQNWEPADWAEGFASRVAREVTRLRAARSAQWLSDATAELGFRVSRSVITDIENGRRRYIAIHELIVLAEALSVSPLELLLGTDESLQISYLPGDPVPRLAAVQRFSGIDEPSLQNYEMAAQALQSAVEAAHRAAQLISESHRENKKSGDGG